MSPLNVIPKSVSVIRATVDVVERYRTVRNGGTNGIIAPIYTLDVKRGTFSTFVVTVELREGPTTALGTGGGRYDVK
jgi:hypothetical protein